MGVSALEACFLQLGTKTEMSVWPRARNHSTASWMPRHENSSLLPWLDVSDEAREKRTQQDRPLASSSDIVDSYTVDARLDQK